MVKGLFLVIYIHPHTYINIVTLKYKNLYYTYFTEKEKGKDRKEG